MRSSLPDSDRVAAHRRHAVGLPNANHHDEACPFTAQNGWGQQQQQQQVGGDCARTRPTARTPADLANPPLDAAQTGERRETPNRLAVSPGDVYHRPEDHVCHTRLRRGVRTMRHAATERRRERRDWDLSVGDEAAGEWFPVPPPGEDSPMMGSDVVGQDADANEDTEDTEEEEEEEEEEEDFAHDAAGAERADFSGPVLQLSTPSLHVHTLPGQLAHAQLTVRNVSAVTVYYRLVCVDRAAECRRSPAPAMATDGDGDGVLEGAAGHVHRARRHLYRAHPNRGVCLPHRATTLTFTVRADTAGYFSSCYALRTFPQARVVTGSAAEGAAAVPARVDIRVMVSSVELPASIAARSVSRRWLDTELPRRLGSEAVRAVCGAESGEGVWEGGGDLGAAAAGAAAAAREQRRRRRAWQRGVSAALRLPYNAAVYDGLARLYRRAGRALEVLERDAEACGDEADTDGGGGVWDGAMVTLMARVMDVRDGAARATVWEGVNVLLQLASVSRRAGEGLVGLMNRLARRWARCRRRRDIAARRCEAAAAPSVPQTMAASVPGSGSGNGTSAKKSRHAASTNHRRTNNGATHNNSTPMDNNNNNINNNNNNNNSCVSHSVMKNTSHAGAANVIDDAATRGAAVAMASPEETAARQLELDARMQTYVPALEEERAQWEQQYRDHFIDVIDAACSLPLLDVVQAWRCGDVARIQRSEVEEMSAVCAKYTLPSGGGGGGNAMSGAGAGVGYASGSMAATGSSMGSSSSTNAGSRLNRRR